MYFQFSQKISMECLISNMKCIFFIQRCEEKSNFNSFGCLAPLGKYKHCVVYVICHWQYTTQTALWTLTDQHTSTTAEGDQEDQEGETSKHNYLYQRLQAVQHCRWKAEGKTMEPEVFIKQQEWTDGGTDGRTHSTFSVDVQLFAPNDGGVVKAVGHFAVERPCTAPSHRQQQHGSFRKLVRHEVAVLVVQQHFVEEPLVPGVGAFGCLTVEPQADHNVVLSNVVVVAHRHRSTNWDWRTVYSNIQTNNFIYYRWTEVLVSKRKAMRNCKNKTVQCIAWPVETAKNVCTKTFKMAVLKYGKEL